MQNSFLAGFKALLLIAFIIIALPFLAVLNFRKSKYTIKFFSISCAVILFIINIRVKVYGKKSQAYPVLYASNHISYLDILIYGKLLEVPFISKSEVRSWPLIGNIASMVGTIFVNRLINKTPENISMIREKLHSNNGIIMFAEGTTSDGNRVLPFKSSYFALAEEEFSGNSLNVQPIALAYTKINNISMGSLYRPYVAWYGDMSLLPHLWELLKFWSIQAEIIFHPPVTSGNFRDRKVLSAYTHERIADAVELMLTGRADDLKNQLYQTQ